MVSCTEKKHTVKLSPLAAKMVAKAGLNPLTILGTGPRGKIMAADVSAAGKSQTPARKVQTPTAPKDTQNATREGDFYVFTLQANMAYLAAISTPIAVQCERLMGGRYTLFDYVVRAAVKACMSEQEWASDAETVNLRMVLDGGNKQALISNAAKKNIYKIATERLAAEAVHMPTEKADIILCDCGMDVHAARTLQPEAPRTIISIGGNSPKARIEAGRPVSVYTMDAMLCLNANIIPEKTACRIAAEFKTLLENPVLLLL